jgi:hypothetical protein
MPRPGFSVAFGRGVEDARGVPVGEPAVSLTGTGVPVVVPNIVAVPATIETGSGDSVLMGVGDMVFASPHAARNNRMLETTRCFMPTPFRSDLLHCTAPALCGDKDVENQSG